MTDRIEGTHPADNAELPKEVAPEITPATAVEAEDEGNKKRKTDSARLRRVADRAFWKAFTRRKED